MKVELNLLCCSHLLEACLGFQDYQVQVVNYPRTCSRSTACPNNVIAKSQLKNTKQNWNGGSVQIKEGKRKYMMWSKTYRSLKEVILPISKGIRPVRLFHITSLEQVNQREDSFFQWALRKPEANHMNQMKQFVWLSILQNFEKG